jgi:superfamily I DNA and RNA helicase
MGKEAKILIIKTMILNFSYTLAFFCNRLNSNMERLKLIKYFFFLFQKKKPDWALGAKEGEGKARPKHFFSYKAE